MRKSQINFAKTIESVTLELTENEAKSLFLITGKLFGSSPIRDELSSIYYKLNRLGFVVNDDHWDISTGNINIEGPFEDVSFDSVDIKL